VDESLEGLGMELKLQHWQEERRSQIEANLTDFRV
jgi:hypothetical protein